MVRLITQNLLSCPSRACAYPTNFPLSFRNVERLEMVDAEFNEEFMRGVLSRIEWNALRKSAAEVSLHRFFLFPSGHAGARIASEDRPFPQQAHLRQTEQVELPLGALSRRDALTTVDANGCGWSAAWMREMAIPAGILRPWHLVSTLRDREVVSLMLT